MRPHGSCGKVAKGGFALVVAGSVVRVTVCSLWIRALQLGNQCVVHDGDDGALDIARCGRQRRYAAERPVRVVQRAG